MEKISIKKYVSIFLAVIFVVTLFSSGCGDDNNTSPTGSGENQTASGTASFTLNGAGFSNQSFSVSGVVGGFENNQTGLTGGSASSENQAVLNFGFPANSTGTFQFDGDNTVVAISLGSGPSTQAFVSFSGSGQIVVTAYGNIGGNITGTFNGTLIGGSTGLDTVTVNGSFNAQRMK